MSIGARTGNGLGFFVSLMMLLVLILIHITITQPYILLFLETLMTEDKSNRIELYFPTPSLQGFRHVS